MLLGKFGKIIRLIQKVKKLHKFSFLNKNQEPKILCLGAHPDDIEIGCGGTILRILEEAPSAEFCWVVFSGNQKRREEAFQSAELFLRTIESKKIFVEEFRESYFPFIGDQIKDFFEKLKTDFSPDFVFTHYRGDAHQDHRLISELTWNTFRNHFILEYEIPKFEGDLATPNLYVNLDESHVRKKIDYVFEKFVTQREKLWFSKETFRSILRIRGVESNSPTNYSEAFHCRKIIF